MRRSSPTSRYPQRSSDLSAITIGGETTLKSHRTAPTGVRADGGSGQESVPGGSYPSAWDVSDHAPVVAEFQI